MSDPLDQVRDFVGRANRAQQAVNDLGAGPPARDVLPGFEDEVAELAAARARLNEAHRLAASEPAVEGPDEDGVYCLTRTHPYVDVDGIQHRAVTNLFTPAMWAVITDAVLAERGLSLKGTS